MNYVQTVNGLIPETELGITLAHEHVFIDSLVWFIESKDDFFKEIRDAPMTLMSLLKKYLTSNCMVEKQL